jgi:hypothetical protein
VQQPHAGKDNGRWDISAVLSHLLKMEKCDRFFSSNKAALDYLNKDATEGEKIEINKQQLC